MQRSAGWRMVDVALLQEAAGMKSRTPARLERKLFMVKLVASGQGRTDN